MHASISLLTAVAATVAAETVVIQAGLKGFTFWPPEAVANQGDIIQFQFIYGNHTVVQSEFNTPCQWFNGGFDSGPIDYKVCLSKPFPFSKFLLLNLLWRWHRLNSSNSNSKSQPQSGTSAPSRDTAKAVWSA
jgi:hypothetical protein